MSPKAQFTIVMVDDDEDEVFITRRLVRRSGIVNDFISERKPENLFSTLDSIHDKASPPADVIVLLDINMPRQNGFETLRKIRENAKFADAPVIMLSASDNEADIVDASQLGADGYLVKPFRSDTFFAALNDVPRVRHQLVLAA
jgi:DNA-binding response OmpR family regulator